MQNQSPRPSDIVFPISLEPVHESVASSDGRLPWGWLEWFTLSQVFWGVLLFIPGSQAYRAYIRAFPYVMSLIALVSCARAGGVGAVPGASWMFAALALLVANLMRPETSMTSGVAQVVFQLAIAAPLFWAARFTLSEERLDRLMRVIFGASFVGALVGLLQVYFPDRFMPPELTSLGLRMSPDFVAGLTYIGADDRIIVRPPGLSDLPGGAAISGTIAALLGFAFAVRPKTDSLPRLAYLAAAIVGITVVYLTHVRSILLIIGGCMLVMALLRLRKGHFVQSTSIALIAGALMVGAFVWAVNVGGEAVSERFTGLAETGVMQTFQQNRGHFLDYTLQEGLTEYPFGAGVGRWGMMIVYFGDSADWRYPPLYAEIQLTGWLFDGGVLMWLFYGGGILVALRYSYRLAISDAGLLGECAAMVFAIQLFVTTLCFAGPAFNTQLGIMFWLATAILFGAHHTMFMEALAGQADLEEGGVSV